ncbi:lipoprotein [Fictibacillus macauensis ZFHKF-1]|uniref:Lipoprotein n=1 Tax=Fictibacillus macauensis ZFHKF-1 TaxID=1196324 RepID=I8AMU9_9BACL|nr:DUF1672 family protein [Fictibacillus macauensis]EIT87029.1 lipoprotein [Fictibacillus macauensis ZFHKF-1]
MTEKKKEDSESSYYTPVQDYDGKAVELPNGTEMSEFAKTHRKEVSDAALRYFNKKYKIKNAKITNLVGAEDAVVAHISSDQLPTFYTSVIVFVKNGVVNHVNELEGNVESAIMSGIYVKAYEKEFQNLENFCKKMTEKYPVVGMREDAIQRVFDSGVVRPFFRVNILKIDAPATYDSFMKNPLMTSGELRIEIEEELKANDPQIALTFFMKKKHSPPDEKLGQQIIQDFKQNKYYPPGRYAVLLSSNEILKDKGDGKSYKGTQLGIDEIQVDIKGR